MVPAIKNTKLYFAVMLPIYVFVYTLIIFLVEFYRYKKLNKNNDIETKKPELE
jgi:hypothetical protein